MTKIKSEFLKNLNKLKKTRGIDKSDFDAINLFLKKDLSGFFPANQSECDAMLLLGSYPLMERQGVFKVSNSLLYLCKTEHPSIDELFESMNLCDSKRNAFIDLVNKYSLDVLDYYNLFRNEKNHDDLSAFSLSNIHNFCFSVADKSKSGSVVSHPVKMTDPTCKQPRIFFEGTSKQDGFIRSGNANIEFDLHINATQLVVFKFLSLPYKGKTLWECIRSKDSSAFSEIFSLRKEEAENLIENFSSCLISNKEKSGSNVRQVYFPTSEGY
ncbi:type I-F CRISPR-associated protein Csy1, partial [Marinospirillum sp.]|uniref:type I-F CRISPR-associated protein Csy1 n=1 Tax=Marinospirillum sp. TaxID=2183934 RepID=UPI00287032DC